MKKTTTEQTPVLTNAYLGVLNRLTFCIKHPYVASEGYINGLRDALKIIKRTNPLLELIK